MQAAEEAESAALAALDGEAYISLATFRRDGRAVATPIWFAADSGKLYVFSEGSAGKVKRLRNFTRIRIAPCGVRGKLKGEWIEGSGRRVDDPTRVEAAYRALLQKYGWQMRTANFFSRLTGRFAQRAILELEI